MNFKSFSAQVLYPPTLIHGIHFVPNTVLVGEGLNHEQDSVSFGYPWTTEQRLVQELLKPPWGLSLGGFRQEETVSLQNDPAKDEGKGVQAEGIPWTFALRPERAVWV